MEFTGERYIPAGGDSRDELSVEHMHRYHSILPLIKGKVVLDIACGEGYGADLMAKTAQKVVGVDISQECITHANDKYVPTNTNLEFLQGDVENIPVPDAAFDVIVSFETMEHVSSEGQKKFLAEAKRVLKKNGKFIISTPDIENYTNRYHHENQFHVHELNRSEFREILNAHFKNVHYLEQGFGIVGYILPPDYGVIKNIQLTNWQRTVKKLKGKYLLAVASDAAIDATEVNSIVMDTDKDYFKQIDRILELQDEVESLSGWGTRLDQEMMEQRVVIRTLNDQVTSLQSEPIKEMSEKINQVQQWMANDLQQKNEFIQSLEKELTRLNQLHEQKDEQIRTFQSELTQLNEIHKEKQDEIQSLQAEIAHLHQGQQLKVNDHLAAIDKLVSEERSLQTKNTQQKDRIIAFEKELKEKERILHDLQFNYSLTMQQMSEVNEKLSTIYGSDGWKILKKYYKIKGRHLNERSILYKALKRTVNFLRNKKDDVGNNNIGGSASPAGVSQQEKKAPVDISSIPIRTLPYFENPEVSIIIPVYNGWEMNEKCIVSIIENTAGVAYEVIIADDKSTDITRDISKVFQNCVHIRNEENLGFLRNCKNAATHAKGKYIHFLNNDTEVKPGWLSSLTRLMELDSKIGMVGSKLVYPDGRLQEAGGIIWNDASGWNYGHKQDPDLPEFNYVKEVDYVSGASIMIRKKLWEEIGGFDERYSPAYFEDTDLAFTVRSLGYKVVYQPLSVVVHYEGYSHGTDTSQGVKKYQALNTEKFIDKWNSVLKSDHFKNADKVFYARDKSQHKKVILVVDHYVPHFDKDAGSRTTYQLLQIFAEMNYNVKFIGDNFYKHEPYTSFLQQMGIEVLYGPWYRDNWQTWVQDNGDKIDFIYLNRPHISIKYIDFFKENTKAKIVYYGHDLHFIREQRQYEIEKTPNLLESMKEWKQTETYLIQNSNAVLTLSYEEKEIMENEMSASNVKIMPAFFYNEFKPSIESFSERKNILFVGGFNHAPNVDAVIWFANEVWPLVTAVIKEAKFIVVGSLVPQQIADLASDSILIKGYVSDSELDEIYESVKMVVIPLRYGAGVKGKTVEAMAKGLPVVSTTFGIEGLKNIYSVLKPVDGAPEFATSIIELYNNEEELALLSAKEISYAQAHFSKAVVETMITETF